MSSKTGGLTRRRFLRWLALLGSLASSARYTESVLADEPATDALGQTLPRRLLGRTGEKVTMLGLGGFHVGSLSDRDAQAMIEAAIEGGIRFCDNAQQYQSGGSEAKYGRLLTPKYRDHIFLTTKSLARDSSAAERDLEGSVRRLRTDHLDLWLMHSVESPEDVERRRHEGVFQVMAEAMRSGKTRYIGVSGHRPHAAHGDVMEAIHFVWSLPVTVLITGAESLDQLHEKIRLAQSFKGMSQEERQRIIEMVADLAGNRVEYYKA